ncbi:hypothetical protein [Aquimarina megaterium]|uniref:hypothetical protein n=1 Tax=Aquimarina megaterium TaxID=1443666 RepID=UPI0004717B69|nr:hypothetical protein [Aquimarina megaterium]
MATIQDLLKLDISKVQPEELRLEVQELINDYSEVKSKEIFEKNAAENIKEIYNVVIQISPDAVVQNPCADPEEEKPETSKSQKKSPSKKDEKKSTSKKEQKSSTKDKPKRTATKKDVDAVLDEIKQCRVKIKKYNEEKRKEEGPKPKPSPYIKIRGHIIALGNLIPEKLEGNLEVQKESKKLLKNTHRSLLKIYGMNAIRGQKDNKELEERFEKIEEKIEAK